MSIPLLYSGLELECQFACSLLALQPRVKGRRVILSLHSILRLCGAAMTLHVMCAHCSWHALEVAAEDAH